MATQRSFRPPQMPIGKLKAPGVFGQQAERPALEPSVRPGVGKFNLKSPVKAPATPAAAAAADVVTPPVEAPVAAPGVTSSSSSPSASQPEVSSTMEQTPNAPSTTPTSVKINLGKFQSAIPVKDPHPKATASAPSASQPEVSAIVEQTPNVPSATPASVKINLGKFQTTIPAKNSPPEVAPKPSPAAAAPASVQSASAAVVSASAAGSAQVSVPVSTPAPTETVQQEHIPAAESSNVPLFGTAPVEMKINGTSKLATPVPAVKGQLVTLQFSAVSSPPPTSSAASSAAKITAASVTPVPPQTAMVPVVSQKTEAAPGVSSPSSPVQPSVAPATVEKKPTSPPVVQIEPSSQLLFRGSFTEGISTSIRLTNKSPEHKVCFKVKTNVPPYYSVHPSIDVIEPLQDVDVTVHLQATSGGQPDKDGQHKFMVQSIYAPSGQIASLEKLWQQAAPKEIASAKLICVFDEVSPKPMRASVPCALNDEEIIQATPTTKLGSKPAEKLSIKKSKTSYLNFFVFAGIVVIAVIVFQFLQ